MLFSKEWVKSGGVFECEKNPKWEKSISIQMSPRRLEDEERMNDNERWTTTSTNHVIHLALVSFYVVPFALAIIHPQMSFGECSSFTYHIFLMLLLLFRTKDVICSEWMRMYIDFIPIHHLHLCCCDSKWEMMAAQTLPKELMPLMRKEWGKWTQKLDSTSGNPVMELGLCRKWWPQCVFTSLLVLWFVWIHFRRWRMRSVSSGLSVCHFKATC